MTANLMRLFNGLDYRKLAKELDVVSWDNYPAFHNDWESFAETMGETAFQQAVACGSDTVQYFQWRKGRGSFEQFHGAVVDHLETGESLSGKLELPAYGVAVLLQTE